MIHEYELFFSSIINFILLVAKDTRTVPAVLQAISEKPGLVCFVTIIYVKTRKISFSNHPRSLIGLGWNGLMLTRCIDWLEDQLIIDLHSISHSIQPSVNTHMGLLWMKICLITKLKGIKVRQRPNMIFRKENTFQETVSGAKFCWVHFSIKLLSQMAIAEKGQENLPS